MTSQKEVRHCFCFCHVIEIVVKIFVIKSCEYCYLSSLSSASNDSQVVRNSGEGATVCWYTSMAILEKSIVVMYSRDRFARRLKVASLLHGTGIEMAAGVCCLL